MAKINYPTGVRVYLNTVKSGTIEIVIFDSERERDSFIKRVSMGSSRSPFDVCPRYKRSDGKECFPISRKV